MPPVTTPVPLRLIENLETSLALADGGSDYFFDLNVIKVGEDPEQAGVYPAVTIGIGELGKLTESVNGRVIWSGTWTWELDIIGYVQGVVKPHETLIQLLHDIHRALMVDFRRGGIAINTIVTGAAMYPPPGPQSNLSQVVVGLEIHFRTKDTTMLEAY
jgi:hypothetical protein